MADIQDFGEKIGGARKDMWRLRGLILDDITDMTDLERQSNIKKDNIWVKPDWEQLIASGTPQALAYWQNLMRQSIPPKSPLNDAETQNNYVEVVGKIRDAVMAVTDPNKIDSFYKDYLKENFIEDKSSSYYVTIVPEARGIVTNKVLKAAQSKYYYMRRDAEKKLFGVPKDEKTYTAVKNRLSVHLYDNDYVKLEPSRDDLSTVLTIKSFSGSHFYYLRKGSELSDIASWEQNKYFVMDESSRKPLKINFNSKQEALDFVETYSRACQEAANEMGKGSSKGSDSKRKGAFIPPQLQGIKRTGPDYRKGHAADSKLYMDDLKFRGGEFGNWLNDDDRQTSLNMAYEAFRDLARILQIKPEDVAFEQTLSIAFGARGRGGANAALAHYEPDRQVINLTKMSGAGCLAHEWGHALDHFIGIKCGIVGLASEDRRHASKLPRSFADLLSSLRYKEIVIDPGQPNPDDVAKLDKAKKGLKSWIDSTKPRKLSEDMQKTWEQAVENLMHNISTFTGVEYTTPGRNTITKPEVEILSEICKSATNRSIPKDTKLQISLWAADVKRYQSIVESKEPRTKRVKTEFYKGSIEFDNQFSRSAHGYWQSECEMFARAFDCYISDKLKEGGFRSDYLSGHANSYVLPDKDGKLVAAIPQGEERIAINKNFDRLFEELKELNILHDHAEFLEIENPEPIKPLRTRPRPEIPNKNVQYEQLSLDELLFNAESKRQSGEAKNRGSGELTR